MENNIEKVLVVSTANISEQTKDELEIGIPHVRSVSHEYGFIVFTTAYFEEGAEDEESGENYKDLAAILKIALANNCSLVNIDADADEYPGLEIYNW